MVKKESKEDIESLKRKISRLEEKIEMFMRHSHHYLEKDMMMIEKDMMMRKMDYPMSRKYFREYERRLEELNASINKLSEDKDFSKKITEINSLQSKIQQIAKDAEDAINKRMTVELAESFRKSKMEYGGLPEFTGKENSSKKDYFVKLIFSRDFIFYFLFLCSLFGICWVYFKFLGKNGFDFKYLPIGFPFVWATWFFQRKISIRNRLYEEYNHKQRIMETYVFVKNNKDNYLYDEDGFFEVVLGAIKRNPADCLGKTETLVDKVLERIDIGKIEKRVRREILKKSDIKEDDE